MGIFDSYYDPSTYQGNSGGSLIDRLLSQLGTQSQYQPAQGFPQSPMNAQAAMPAQAAPQNDPIAIGNYQMPRIGGGFPEETAPQPAAPIQQPAAMPVAQQPPALLQPQHAPGGFGSAVQGAIANMQNGPLGMIGGAIAGGMGMGQGTALDQKRRELQQKYTALIPILGEQKARLAVLGGAEAEKQLLQDALGKTYNFATLPDGTVLRQDPKTGAVEPAYAGSTKPEFGIVREEDGKKVYGWKDPSRRNAPNAGVTEYQPAGSSEDRGTVNGPDGKPIPIPPGVDRKTFVNEISKSTADALTGKKTEVQAKSEKFGNQMELAEKNIKGLESEYTSTLGAGGFFRGTEYLPGGNMLQSDNYQKFRQARDSFLTALLRDESGAAIGTSEFNRREKEMFPQPGDGPEIIAQKRELRRVAIEGMKKAAGPGYKSPTEAASNGGPKADPLGIR
ncbi:hypothetical protein CO678_41990 [Bradyrhizobium diazoefficiens]|uniref:hypothetical protein n=1 Tax=Bradyrhizobium diazoefficiens TaxID=1355477 RepID=UPI000BEA11C8|nr:hypothetical protein [Bradyrhizobium diazoefficiens]PDT55762.1 hypothetical protein CO678_41990 [Bradyrhizobium diazoefficiens]